MDKKLKVARAVVKVGDYTRTFEQIQFLIKELNYYETPTPKLEVIEIDERKTFYFDLQVINMENNHEWELYPRTFRIR